MRVGFEPTPPEGLVPKTSALDHSAISPMRPHSLVCLDNSQRQGGKGKEGEDWVSVYVVNGIPRGESM